MVTLFNQLEELDKQLSEKHQIETSIIVSTKQNLKPKFSPEVLDLEKRFGIKIRATHTLIPWLVRHVAWLVTNIQIRKETGKSPYEERTGKAYDKEVLAFGEVVYWKVPGEHREKLQENWLKGIWIGKHTESDEHLLMTESGIKATRSVRRTTAPRTARTASTTTTTTRRRVQTPMRARRTPFPTRTASRRREARRARTRTRRAPTRAARRCGQDSRAAISPLHTGLYFLGSSCRNIASYRRRWALI